MRLYEVLGVDPTAPPAEVRQAYLTLARQHHPDRDGGDAATMRAINEAWATLSDPVRRARYDRTLHEPVPPIVAEDLRPPRTDEEELRADLADDTPLGGRVVLPPWISLLPVAVFAASVVTVVAAVVLGSTTGLAVSFVLFLLSCAMFLAAPFVALLSSRRNR